jgi:hypothetical protein
MENSPGPALTFVFVVVLTAAIIWLLLASPPPIVCNPGCPPKTRARFIPTETSPLVCICEATP